MTLSLPSLWHDFALRWHFKVTLPATRKAKLHGVRLDISKLSPLMKNNILEGRYEFQERRLARQCLSSKDTVLELGGAIGFIGLYCRKVLGIRHHLTVEANPRTIEMLRRNYAFNHLQPQVLHAAAAAEDGVLELDVGGEFWENSVYSTHSDRERIPVPAQSLGSLVKLMPQPPTALICDIEGAETQLDFSQLPSSVTRIIIELHPQIVGEHAHRSVVENIQACGFKAQAVEENTWLFTR